MQLHVYAPDDYHYQHSLHGRISEETYQCVEPCRMILRNLIIVIVTEPWEHLVDRLGHTIGIAPLHSLLRRERQHTGRVDESGYFHTRVYHRLGYHRVATPAASERVGHMTVTLGRSSHHGTHIWLILVWHRRAVGPVDHSHGTHRRPRTHIHAVTRQSYQRAGRRRIVVDKRHHRHPASHKSGAYGVGMHHRAAIGVEMHQ